MSKYSTAQKWTKPVISKLGELTSVANVKAGSKQCNKGGQQCTHS